MSQIHVLDGKTDFMLAVLSNTNENTIFYDDIHLQQLSDSKETFDFTTVPESDATPFLRERNRLVIPVDGGIFREFIIDETIQDFHKVEVYSTASHLELKKGKPLPPGKHEGQSLNTMMDLVLAGTGWKRGNTDYSGTATIEFDKYVSPFQALQETAFAHDMELSFRIETNGNKVTGRYVDAVKRIGGFLGRELNSGKDLVNATRRESTEDVVTALVGIGPEKENGDRVVVEVTNEEARQVWGRDGRHLWEVLEVQSDNEEMSEAQVRQYTTQALNARIAAAIEYTIDGADLEQVLGLENEKIRLGDSVRIKATEYEPPLYLDARVIAIESSISDPTEKTFTLGEFIEYEERDIRALREQFQYLLAQKTNLFFSDEPPVNTHWIWVDTSSGKNVMKTYNYVTGEWDAVEGAEGPQGPPGEDGVSSYTHIAYANSSDGLTDFSVSDSEGRAYLGIYVDSNPVDSQNPLDYNWTLIKGAKGDEGIAGKTGADGRTPYFHTAWADSPDGRTNFSTTEAGTRAYLGTYTDYTQADSTDPSKYSWAKIQGPEGEKGDKGDTGEKGDQGVPGPKGENGQTLYTWIKYADTATGGGISDSPTGKSYIGLAYNKTTPTESSQASDYTWSLLKGDQGAEGPKGKDGQTLYTWVKYADNPLGGGMSDDPTGKAYMGIAYNKTSQTESTDATQYSWSLIKGQDGQDGKDGADGAPGKDGANGKDGVTTYTWIKYADNAVGGGMSDSPTGKKYLGVAHNKTSPTESTNAADYSWSLIQGPQGPNIVDSSTQIAANVIKSNHINVGQLSAITSDLGYVNAGTLNAVDITGSNITGTTITGSVFQSSDGYVSMELTDGYGKIEDNSGSWSIWNAGSFQVGTINVSQSHRSVYVGTTSGGAGYIGSDSSNLQIWSNLLMSQGKAVLGDGLLRLGASDSWGNISSYINMYSGGGISISPSSRLTTIYGALEISGPALRLLSGTSMSFQDIGSYGNQLYLNGSGEWVKNYRETGYCGVGAREHVRTSGTLAGVGVNFRTQKNYTPSSAGLYASAGNVTPYAIDFSGNGFWLYINGTNTVGAYPYWRGTYNC